MRLPYTTTADGDVLFAGFPWSISACLHLGRPDKRCWSVPQLDSP
jgi:hypothetical protein